MEIDKAYENFLMDFLNRYIFLTLKCISTLLELWLSKKITETFCEMAIFFTKWFYTEIEKN